MLAIKAVVKNGLIKPLEAIDLPEDKEIVIYISEEKAEEEYPDWTDEEWQRFSLHSFMNTEDDKDVNWVDSFNVEKKRIKHQEETGFAKKVLGNKRRMSGMPYNYFGKVFRIPFYVECYFKFKQGIFYAGKATKK